MIEFFFAQKSSFTSKAANRHGFKAEFRITHFHN